jgi:hypothetical protein
MSLWPQAQHSHRQMAAHIPGCMNLDTPLLSGSAFIDFSLTPAPSQIFLLYNFGATAALLFSICFDNEPSDGAHVDIFPERIVSVVDAQDKR